MITVKMAARDTAESAGLAHSLCPDSMQNCPNHVRIILGTGLPSDIAALDRVGRHRATTGSAARRIIGGAIPGTW